MRYVHLPTVGTLLSGVALAGIGIIFIENAGLQSLLMGAMLLIGAMSALLGIRWHKPSFALSWWCITGFFLFAEVALILDVVSGYENSHHNAPAFIIPSLISTAFCVSGLGLLLVRRMPSISFAAGVDWLIIMVAVSLARWSISVNQTGGESSLSLIANSTQFATTLSVIVLLVRMAAAAENRLPSLWFLFIAPFVDVGADFVLPDGVGQISAGTVGMNPTDLLLMSMIACSAIHPSMAQLSRRLSRHVRPTKISYRLLVFAFALLAIPYTAVAEMDRYHRLSIEWQLGAVLLIGVVAVRMSIVLRVQHRVERALAVRARQERAVSELSRLALKESNPRVLASEAISTIADTLQIELAVALEPTTEPTELIVTAQSGDDSEIESDITVSFSAPSLISQAFSDGVAVQDTRDTSNVAPSIPGLPQSKSSLAVAIQGRDRPIGVICVFSNKMASFEDAEVTFVSSIADLLANAILRQTVEEDLQQARRLESVGRLAAGLAHEINTPIQYINSNARFLSDTIDTMRVVEDKRHQVLETPDVSTVAEAFDRIGQEHDVEFLLTEAPLAVGEIVGGTDRIAAIVRAMKAFGANEHTETELVHINESLRDTLAVANSEIEPHAEIELDLGEIPPLHCRLGEINQVFLNVIVNAAHAIADVAPSTRERGRLTVRTRLEDDHIVVTIADTGSGIPAEIRGRVFEPFFTTKEVGRGAGQGLTLVRKLVLEHGGSVTFDSTDAGTTFTLRFPTGDESTDLELAAIGAGHQET